MASLRIDLNADVGESYFERICGDDSKLIPWVSSVNIACGFHGGDPLTIRKAISFALNSGARIGAHPSYQDLDGFGRKEMNVADGLLESQLIYQVGALKSMVAAQGGELGHVKLHGALYHRAARDGDCARILLRALTRLALKLRVIGPAGSELERQARAAGFEFWREAFVDRLYLPDGSLASRQMPGSVFSDPAQSAAQALKIVREGNATASDGREIPIEADTLCLHGDNPAALAHARAVHDALLREGVRIG